MTTARQATHADIDAIVDMGFRFIAHSEYGHLVSPTRDDVARGLDGLIRRGVVFVAELNGKIIGMLAGMLSEVWFSPSTKFGVELTWWVNEEHRGGRAAFVLLKKFEEWCKESGARVAVMSELVLGGEAKVGKILNRLGYRMAECSHIKEL